MNPLQFQTVAGLFLAALVAFQILTGLRVLRLGRYHVRIHRVSGITLGVLVVPHLVFGLWLAFGLFNGVLSPLFG